MKLLFAKDYPLIRMGESGQIVNSICLSFWGQDKVGAGNTR